MVTILLRTYDMIELLSATIDTTTWEVKSNHYLLTKEVVLEVFTNQVYALAEGTTCVGLKMVTNGNVVHLYATRQNWILLSDSIKVTESELLDALKWEKNRVNKFKQIAEGVIKYV
jgi:hypothetical protein